MIEYRRMRMINFPSKKVKKKEIDRKEGREKFETLTCLFLPANVVFQSCIHRNLLVTMRVYHYE